MLGLYVSDHPLLGLEHVLSNGTDCTIGQLMLDEERAGRLARSRSAAWSPRCSARSPSAATPGRWSRSRTSTARSTCCCSRAPTSSPARCSPRTRSSRSRAGSRASKDQPEIHGQEVTVPDLSDGPSGPVVIRLPSTRCTPPVVEQLKDVLGTHPGMTEVRLRAADARPRPRCMRLDDRLRVTPEPGAVRRPQAAARARMPGRADRRWPRRRRPRPVARARARGARGRGRARCRWPASSGSCSGRRAERRRRPAAVVALDEVGLAERVLRHRLVRRGRAGRRAGCSGRWPRWLARPRRARDAWSRCSSAPCSPRWLMLRVGHASARPTPQVAAAADDRTTPGDLSSPAPTCSRVRTR